MGFFDDANVLSCNGNKDDITLFLVNIVWIGVSFFIVMLLVDVKPELQSRFVSYHGSIIVFYMFSKKGLLLVSERLWCLTLNKANPWHDLVSKLPS